MARLRGVRALLREARWEAEWLLPSLRPGRAGRLTRWWLAERRGRTVYRIVSEDELRAARRSDTVFVFGSGRSLTEVTPTEWQRISQHDTVGFSHFHRQRWVRVDYHLVAEAKWLDELAESIRGNPGYAGTIFGVMHGWSAESANEIVARRILPSGARLFRWRRIGRSRVLPPSRSLDKGLVHGSNSILDVVNFAALLGWRRIVIAGVDLYNKEYFWLPPEVTRPDEKPEFTAASEWPQGRQVVEMLALWRGLLEHEGIELLVYNPRSLLAQALPVFAWPPK